jgi:hypothetical protein
MKIRHIIWEEVLITCDECKNLSRTFKDAYIRFGNDEKDVSRQDEKELKTIYVAESTMNQPKTCLYRKAEIVSLTDSALVAKAYWWSHNTSTGEYHEFPVEIRAHFDRG